MSAASGSCTGTAGIQACLSRRSEAATKPVPVAGQNSRPRQAKNVWNSRYNTFAGEGSSMSRTLMVAIALLPAAFPGRSPACTIFTVVADGQVWLANNEDWVQGGLLWFVPAGEGRFGRVNVGFDLDFAQGGMNEKGLCFDGTALAKIDWKADPNKKSTDNLIELVMNECSTVQETIGYFEKYNCQYLIAGQFMFADAGGDSAVISWLPEVGLSVVRRSRDYQVVTNDRLEQSGYRCQRFTKAEQLLGARKDSSLSTIAAVLEAVHQRGPRGFTSYSTIYNLTAKKFYLYNLANFKDVAELDLATELAKGRKMYLMHRLVANSPKVADLKTGEQRVDFATRVELDSATLEKYAGTYRPAGEEEKTIHVERSEGNLRVKVDGQPDAVLYPESETRFRISPDRGQVSFRIGRNGTVEGLILHKSKDLFADRIP
jgi:hypothetical protein